MLRKPESDGTQARTKLAQLRLQAARSVALVDALPISGAGKVLKRELRKQHRDTADRNVS